VLELIIFSLQSLDELIFLVDGSCRSVD